MGGVGQAARDGDGHPHGRVVRRRERRAVRVRPRRLADEAIHAFAEGGEILSAVERHGLRGVAPPLEEARILALDVGDERPGEAAVVEVAQRTAPAHGQTERVGDGLGRLEGAPRRRGVDGGEGLPREPSGERGGLRPAHLVQPASALHAALNVPRGAAMANEDQA